MYKKYCFKLNSHPFDGLILQIHHTVRENGSEIRRIRFTAAAFNGSGEKLASSDHRGNIFISDLLECVYWSLPIKASRVLSFVPSQCDILLAACIEAPFDVMLVDIRNGSIISSLSGHTSRAENSSFSTSLQYIITSSSNEAIIWELNGYTKYFVLDTQDNVYIKEIKYAPISDNIIACFQNHTLKIWNHKTLEPIKEISQDVFDDVTSFAFTVNGRAMVTGGSSPILSIINMDTWIVENVNIKNSNISSIKSLQFLPELFDGGSNKILLILSGNCVVYFYDIESFVLLYSLSCESSKISKIVSSPNGKYLACILQLGELNLYKSSLLKKDYEIRNAKTSHTIESLKRKNIKRDDTKPSVSDKCERIKANINRERLQRILIHFNEYPSKYRITIWKLLLNIPQNRDAYIGLNNRPSHPSSNIDSNIKLQSSIYIKHLKRLVSCLSYWCPIIAPSPFIIGFIFPFVKMLHKDPLCCFEAVATILINYCQYWFVYTPLPPINVLATIENLLAVHDKNLLNHFYKHNVTSEIYAWKMLKTAFSEVLLPNEWMILWDHILSNEPAFILLAVAAYNIMHRNTLMVLDNKCQFSEFFISQNPINMKTFVKKCYFLLTDMSEVHPRQYLKPLLSLEKGSSYTQYPINSVNVEIVARKRKNVHRHKFVRGSMKNK